MQNDTTLEGVIEQLDVIRIVGNPARQRVRGVTCDSRKVGPGDVFVCIRGAQHDGHRFIDEAVRRRAGALIVDSQYEFAEDVGFSGMSFVETHTPRAATGDWPLRAPPIIQVNDVRLAYAHICATLAGNPARHLHITGISGTNGKTSTAFYMDAIYRARGFKTGVISTVFCRIGEDTFTQSLTTPEAGEVQQRLGQMRSQHVRRVALEVSSHALSMHRVTGCKLRTAIFTNLGRDHLDYHGGWNEYRRTKQRLFELLDPKDGRAIINVDDAAGRFYARTLDGMPLTTYAMRRDADVRGTFKVEASSPGLCGDEVRSGGDGGGVRGDPDRPLLQVMTPDGTVTARLNCPGVCNAYNALAAAAAAWTEGIDLTTIARGLSDAVPPPGRFQRIEAGQAFRVYVDFAHNPVALAQALLAVGLGRRGKLRLVFGSKGDDADHWKRRLMGRVAARYADDIIVTTDNPLAEEPGHIASHIAAGVADADFPSGQFAVILDRAEAIRTALDGAEAGDVVLLAGRGHERTQRFGDFVLELNDAVVAEEWLRPRYGQ